MAGRAKTVAFYGLSFLAGIWVCTTWILDTQKHAIGYKVNGSVAGKTVQLSHVANVLEVISSQINLIDLGFHKSTSTSARLAIFENETGLILNGLLYQQLLDNGWIVESTYALDPRLFHKQKSKSIAQNITTHILLYKSSQLIHLSILIPRHDYYWTAALKHEFYNFEEPSRAFDQALLNSLTNTSVPQLLKPSNQSLWSWHQKYSVFLECNYEMIIWPFRNLYPQFIESHNESLVRSLHQTIRKLSLKHKIPFQIYGGSLLGWYRQCDYIPYSKDVDVIINETYFTHELFKDMWNGNEFRVQARYGKLMDSLEVRAVHIESSISTDFFTWHFEPNITNETYVNYYYAGNFHVHRYSYPVIRDLCTAELLGALVYVPCDPVLSLDREYSEGWFHPRRSYVSQQGRFYKKYNASQWPDHYHYYRNKSCSLPNLPTGCD